MLVLVVAVFSGGYYESTYTLLCAGVWLALAIVAAFRPAPAPSAAAVALGAFAVLTLVSGAWGDPGAAARVAPLAALYAGVVYAAEWAGSGRNLLRGARAGLVAVAALAIIVRIAGIAPTVESGSARLAWPVGYANGLGLLCATGVLLALALRPRAYLGGAVCAAALVWTGSRSALAGLAAGVVVLALARSRRRAVWGLAIVVCAAAAAIAFGDAVYHRVAEPVHDTRNVGRLLTLSGHGRTELWRAAWDEGRAHPLAGGGAGTWRAAATRNLGRANVPANAHSLALETFAELGVLGVLCLAAALYLVFRRATAAQGPALAVVAAWLTVAAVDWDWQLPAVTGIAMIAAGTVTGTGARLGPRGSLALSVCALAIGVAAGVQLALDGHG